MWVLIRNLFQQYTPNFDTKQTTTNKVIKFYFSRLYQTKAGNRYRPDPIKFKRNRNKDKIKIVYANDDISE